MKVKCNNNCNSEVVDLGEPNPEKVNELVRCEKCDTVLGIVVFNHPRFRYEWLIPNNFYNRELGKCLVLKIHG